MSDTENNTENKAEAKAKAAETTPHMKKGKQQDNQTEPAKSNVVIPLVLLLVAAIVGKLVGAFLIKEPWPVRWVIAMAMIPRGEVGLIFAELGRVSKIFNNEIYAGMVIVIALTTLLPPFIMKWVYGHYGDRL